MRLIRLLTVLFLVVVQRWTPSFGQPASGVKVGSMRLVRLLTVLFFLVVPLQGVEVSYRIFSLDRGVVRRLWVDRRVVHRATPLAWLSPPEALPALQTKQEGPA